ncbi:MAG: TetR/AcrR family transcriptional regulator [Burkholderiaceae bacterium]|nr:TetR/AcrR family transcriptional regulator [Burkholderiaceae bacterium]
MVDTIDTSRRSLILREAARLFRESGFERTSVRQIAEAVDMTSGSLFYHFTSKEDLLVAVMEEGVRDVFAAVSSGLAGEPRLPERVLAMVQCHLTALLGLNLDALTVMIYEWRSLSPQAHQRVMKWRDAYEELWASPIGEAAALGWVDSDTVLVRQTVLGALNWTGQWYRPDRRLGVDMLARRMFALLFPRLSERLGAVEELSFSFCQPMEQQ